MQNSLQTSDVYYEDLQVGDTFVSVGRTLTETDIVNFAGLSGDYNALHTDAEFAKGTIFGQRIAHGLLGLVIGSGLFTRMKLAQAMSETTIALLELDEWKFRKPIFAGDTIHLEVVVAEAHKTSKCGRGIVTFWRKLLNQHGEIVQDGKFRMMIKCRE